MWKRLGIILLFALTGCAGLQGSDRAGPNLTGRESPRERVVKTATHFLGTPYRFGGGTPEKGFDCSGYVAYVFSRSVGLDLPHYTGAQIRRGQPVSSARLLPGDLVFFRIDGRPPLHVGIYLGGNRFIHAPSRDGEVSIERLDHSYWRQRYRTARRLLPPFIEKGKVQQVAGSSVGHRPDSGMEGASNGL